MSFCQHEYAVLQIAKIQKFFELTKNIFPSTHASLFNALYINTLFRNPTNPFRIPFPFLRWPFSCRRWPSSFPLPIPPLFAHSPFHFSLFRPTCHLFPQLRTHRYNSFLPLIFLARFQFLDTVNLFRSLPVSCSPFPSIISIHCPFPAFTPFLLSSPLIQLSSHSSNSLIYHSSIVCFFFGTRNCLFPHSLCFQSL